MSPLTNPSGLGSLRNEADLVRFIERQLGGVSLQRVGTALRGLANLEDWHEVGAADEPPFENSWVNFDTTTHQQARFRKDPFGTVFVEGVVKNGTMAAAIFTLSAGYRPGRRLVFSAMTGGTDADAEVDVETSGVVKVQTGTNAFAFINHIFKAEQ